MGHHVWFQNNDMLVTVSGVKTSTMNSTSYLNNSTNVRAAVWKATSTASTADRIVNNRLLSYVSGTNGNYRGVIQSTEHSMGAGIVGLAILTLNHLGTNSEWRVPFLVEPRRTT